MQRFLDNVSGTNKSDTIPERTYTKSSKSTTSTKVYKKYTKAWAKNTSPERSSRRRRFEPAAFVPNLPASSIRNESRERKRRRTPNTRRPKRQRQPPESSVTAPFTRTDRLRKRRKLGVSPSKESGESGGDGEGGEGGGGGGQEKLDGAAEAIDDEEYDDDLDLENPLHDYMDMVTMDRIINPAMSTTGQVMGMASWIKCLKEYGRCPITQQPIHPEDLTILTRVNFRKFNKKFNITTRLRKF